MSGYLGKQLRNLGGCRRDLCGVSAHHAYSGTSRSAPWSNRLLIGGRMRQVMAPLAAGVQERQPQLLSLEAFGEKLSAGMVCAVRVVRDDLAQSHHSVHHSHHGLRGDRIGGRAPLHPHSHRWLLVVSTNPQAHITMPELKIVHRSTMFSPKGPL